MDAATFDQLISTAIRREIEANAFYREVAKRVRDESVRAVFVQLAREELGHRELLERYRADPSMAMKIAVPVRDTKVAEATELPKLSADMKPVHAIALAMKKELRAAEFYRGLSEGSTDAQVRAVLDHLAYMELGHKARLEEVFVQIGYPEAF
jgi:rubrerythrin